MIRVEIESGDVIEKKVCIIKRFASSAEGSLLHRNQTLGSAPSNVQMQLTKKGCDNGHSPSIKNTMT